MGEWRTGVASPRDPGRRDRIIDAAVECVAELGVAKTTHRAVAERCGVPVGSVTYYFSGLEELLLEVFARYVRRVADYVGARFNQDVDRAGAIDAVVALIHEDFQIDPDVHLLGYELYALAARRPQFRSLQTEVIDIGLNALERHFGKDAARAINAYIEGVSEHLGVDARWHAMDQTRRAVAHLASLETPADGG